MTPFYSKLSNVGTTVLANDTAGGVTQLYYTPVLYNSVETKGVEIESDIALHRYFSVRAALTFQSAKYPSWKAWNVGNDGIADDKVVDYSGNKAENNPSAIITLTPTFSKDRFYALVQWKYLGERPVNQPNAYMLPAFSQFDFGAGYQFTKRLGVAININNLTDVLGIMGSASPGGIIPSFSPQSFTKEQVAANPNAVHAIIPIQPRAFFLSATYKF